MNLKITESVNNEIADKTNDKIKETSINLVLSVATSSGCS